MEDNYSKSGSLNMSADVRQLASAMIKARQEFRTLLGNATGSVGSGKGYEYATLDLMYESICEGLDNNLIWITHSVQVNDTWSTEIVETVLTHAPTGQWVRDQRLNIPDKPGNQGRGSANTYCKKNAVLALCAIHVGKDDDGQEGQKYVDKKVNESRINSSSFKSIADAIRQCKDPSIVWGAIAKGYKVATPEEILESDYDDIMDYIQRQKDK